VVAATAVEAAWAGGACIRVEERKKAKEATRMVNDRRSFWRDRRVFWEVVPNSDILFDGCEASLGPVIMLMEVVRR